MTDSETYRQAHPIIESSGLDPAEFHVVAYAPFIEATTTVPAKQALVSGRYADDAHAIVRGHPTYGADGADPFWHAVAVVSKSPTYVFHELDTEDRERLRAESLTPAGAERPVGQDKVIGLPDPVPYAPPMPASSEYIDTTAVEEPPRPAGEPTIEPLDCGPKCVRFVGEDGEQEAHDANTCTRSAEADRG